MIDRPINRLKPICYYTGLVVLVLNALQILPIVTALAYREWPIALAFVASLSIASLVAAALMLLGTRERFAKLSFGEGMVVAAGSWFLCMLLNHTTTTAGTTGFVFGYSPEEPMIATELLGSTDLTFYDNGIVLSKWSHNQGLAGDFWPYNILKYDASIDCYLPYGAVDAWDKSVRETNDEGQPFPTEIDKSGTGIVYYIRTGGEAEFGAPVDQAEYLAWLDSVLAGAHELEIPYLYLNSENVALLRTMQ